MKKLKNWLNKGNKGHILLKHTLIFMLVIMLNTAIFIKYIPALVLSSIILFYIFYFYIEKKL